MAYPPPQSGPPTSFKTNVNRAKTKRWVEAKSYSYDGDDWGDADDYDDYKGYEDPPAPPASKPTGLRQRGQSATHPTQVQHETYQGLSQGGRHGFDNTVGTSHTQNPHGARSVTNPQLEHQSTLARSNSFDRGDERRAFSGPGPQQNLSSPIEPAQQSNSSQQVLPQALAPQNSGQRTAVQKNPGQSIPVQQQQYGSLPNQEGLTPSSSSPSIFAGEGLVQSPMDSQAKKQVSMQSEAGRQQAGLQSHLDSDQHPPRSQQSYLPVANYGTSSRPEQAPQLSFDKKKYSVDNSENSSHDFENRHDLSQLGPQRQLQTGGSPSPQQFSESISSSSFPPRKSSLTQGLPNLPHAPPVATLAPSGGESHPVRDRTGNNDLGKPPIFVRPAEIYKRMQEEQERSKQSQDSTTPNVSSNTRGTIDGSVPSIYSSDSVSPNIDMIEERASTSGTTRVLSQTLEPSSNRDTAQKNHGGIEARTVASQRPYRDQIQTQAGLDTTLRPVLPDVTRMSSFGDLFTTATSNTEGYSTPPLQEPTDLSTHATPLGPSQHTVRKDLQHQQSIGLRSVVHQAFDTTEDQIPPTPSSMAGSAIARSTSGGTSVISPIISRGPSLSRAIPNSEKEGERLSDPQAESDEFPVDKSTPISSSKLTTPKQLPRNVSPSQPSGPIIGDLPPPNFIPGHRRDTSTPSPNNSPARTPALESSKLVQPLQLAELAVVTPTEPAPTNNFDSQIWNSASRNESIINVVRSGDTATERQPVDWKPLNLEARSPKPYVPSVTDTSIKRQGESIPGSPVTPLKGPLSSRPESPSKNRVRDLAGKFESNSSSRRGSDHSISQSNALLSSAGQKADDASPTRPVVDRLESFRPRLPGAWESFSSNAPKRASVGQIEKESAPQEQVLTSPMLEHSTEASLSPESVPHESQSNTAEENKDISSVIKAVQATQDSFAAAAAAGVALAGALTAAIGINQEGSSIEPVDGPPSNDKEAKYSTEVTEGMKRNRNFSVDTVLHPEALRPPRPHSAEGDTSSGPPTPSSKDLPNTTDYVENELKERVPADPAAESGGSNVPVLESNWNHRNQAMLPPLSTDTRKHQYESDKLRREIVKNLSPQGASEPTTAESESPWQDNSRLSADSDVQAYGRDSMAIPKEYESYWNGSNSGGDLSRSSSDPSRLQSASTFNQARHTQITPPKPLQLGRATQPGNDSTQEHTFDASKQLPMEDHRHSGEKEPFETPLPARQLRDRQINDTSLQVPENPQRMSELPEPHHAKDPNYHPSDGDRRASLEATLPASDHISYRTRAETEDLPQSFSDMSEPNTGLNESGYPPGRSWVQEQPLPNVPLSNPSHFGSRPSSGSATAVSHIENRNSTPSQHRAQPETLSEFARTPVSVDNNYDLPSPPLPLSAQPKVRAFREIMALKSPEERIRAYEEARDQIAHQNTGLAHWLAVKSRELPEHADIFSGSQRPLADGVSHKSSPSRSKLSGLRPAGAQPTPQPYYQQYLGASQHNISSEAAGVSNASGISGSQGFSPGGTGSKTAGHNVQTKTKDFLHSAGLFGAKGLFSKGKSKLRGSGGVDKVSSSIPSSDVISRGMQPQNEPPTGPQSQTASIQHLPKEPLISERSPPVPPNSVQDLNLGGAARPSQSQYLEGNEQNGIPITQGHLNDPTNSLPYVSRAPTSSSIETGGHSPSQSSAKIIPRDALKHIETIASSHSTVSSTTPTEAPDPNSKRPAAYFDTPIPEAFNRSAPYESASNSLPLDQHAHSQRRPVLDAPRLPYPDVGGRFHGEWDDQRELGVSQMTNSRYSQSEPISTEFNQCSGDSNSIFQAGTHLEQSQRTSERDINRERSHQSRSRPSKSVTEKQSIDRGSLFSLTEDRAKSPQRRPFSFMELSPNKTQKPVQEVLQNVRGDEANPSGSQYDGKPSPVSPQRSMHDLRDQYSQAVPAQDHTGDDSLLSEKQLELATQSGSYHLQDPNLHEHPAFRHGPPSVDNSSLSTDYVSAEIPRQVSSMHLERLPPAVPPHGAITKSWRDPSGPPFFSTLSAATKAEEPASIAKPGDTTSPSDTPGAPETKRKRASLFRSLNGRSGKDRDRGRDNPEIIASPLATHTQQKIMSNYHETAKVDTRTSESSKARNKLQRASTSVIPEQDPGKKRRFSALGSLFGRSNQDKARPKTQAVHSNPPVQNPPSVDQPKTSHSRNVHSASMHQQQQGYYFAPQDYYAQPIQGEYYAPGQQFDHTPSRMIQPTRQAYPRAPESPAYVQDTALRQGNMVHSHYMGTAGNKSPAITTPPPASRQSLARGNSEDSRYSSVPAPGHHAIHDSSLVDSGRTLRPENSSRQTGQTGSASQLRSVFPLGTHHHKPQSLQQPQHHPSYSLHETHHTPQYPPTPPPKDDWPSGPQHPSLAPSPSPHYNFQQSNPSPSPRFPLPPIHSNAATSPSGEKTPREKAEMRKSRQMEIEHGISRAESNAGKGAGAFKGGSRSHPTQRNEGVSEKELVKVEGDMRDRRDSTDSVVVMSSTSYPGMEWQPREFSRWDGN